MVAELRHVGGVRVLRKGLVHQPDRELAQRRRSRVLVAQGCHNLQREQGHADETDVVSRDFSWRSVDGARLCTAAAWAYLMLTRGDFLDRTQHACGPNPDQIMLFQSRPMYRIPLRRALHQKHTLPPKRFPPSSQIITITFK